MAQFAIMIIGIMSGMNEEMRKKEVLTRMIPAADSHKGQNGKVMVIGGSELFHAASKWCLDVLVRIVDMVFYCSTAENNKLVAEKMRKEVKGKFWGGIVVERENLEEYIEEADVILIGPGMERNERTKKLTNELLMKFPDKKWVIDAGALQMGKIELFPTRAILTPHEKELSRLIEDKEDRAGKLADGIILLVKGKVDKVMLVEGGKMKEVERISGGNAGMTKGGTGDCLAGLAAGIYAKNEDGVGVAEVASVVCKRAGEELWKKVGPFFSASDLAEKIPEVLWEEVKKGAEK